MLLVAFLTDFVEVSSTAIAKFEFTSTACHVIAASVFLDIGTAVWTGTGDGLNGGFRGRRLILAHSFTVFGAGFSVVKLDTVDKARELFAFDTTNNRVLLAALIDLSTATAM